MLAIGQAVAVNSVGVDEDGVGWTITFAEPEVSQLRLDSAFSVLLGDGTVIRVETPFDLTIDGATRHLQAADSDEIVPALGLLHESLASARVEKAGTLQLAFQNGWLLTVPPDERYENWQLTVEGIGMWVGLPGGDVALFPPT